MLLKYFTQGFLVHNPFGTVPAFVSVKVFIQQQLTIFQASQHLMPTKMVSGVCKETFPMHLKKGFLPAPSL